MASSAPDHLRTPGLISNRPCYEGINDNAWAYVGYAFLHADILHLIGNVGLLLICGGLIEDKLSRRWFLVFIVVCIPLGGYLSVIAAPIFIDSPWDDGLTSVGFSIVGNAIFVLCTSLTTSELSLHRCPAVKARRMATPSNSGHSAHGS